MDVTLDEHGIGMLDSGHVRARLDAIHFIVENGHVAIVDTATAHAVPRVLAALAALGLAPEAVDCVILTHVHLDHAGGAGALLRHLPRAQLIVHPRGVRHMVDPSRLIAGTEAVYGPQRARALCGDMVPVPAARIVAAPAGTCVDLAGRTLRFHETPGHARHHVAVHDERSGHVFAGDTFGLSYRELDEGDRQFVFPTTSPVQFDPQPYHRSVDLVAGLASEVVHLTHYGALREPERQAAHLHRLIDAHVALARAAHGDGALRERRLYEGVRELLLDAVHRHGTRLSDAQAMAVYGLDVELNARGLAVWLNAQSA